MSPLETFEAIVYKFVAIPLKLISYNYTDPQFKVNGFTIFVVFCGFFYSLFGIVICFDKDFETCTQSLVFSLIGFQVIVFSLCLIKLRF